MSKSRLTITLSEEILNAVDHTIDGKTVRNRSHAIEALLTQQLSGSISQAIILIGGHEQTLSNALIQISGKPLINHTIDLLLKYNINQIIIATDQPIKQLKKVIASNHVQIIHQRQNLGNAGAIYHLKDSIHNQPFLVIHGDIYTDLNLEALASFHTQQNKLATLCVKPKLNQQQYGKVIMQGNMVTQFLDNPQHAEVGMINTGVYLFNPEIINRFNKRGKQMLETDIFPQLAKEQLLSGYIFEGMWYEVKQ